MKKAAEKLRLEMGRGRGILNSTCPSISDNPTLSEVDQANGGYRCGVYVSKVPDIRRGGRPACQQVHLPTAACLSARGNALALSQYEAIASE